MKPIFHHPTEIVYGQTNPELFISTRTFDSAALRAANGAAVVV